MSENFSHDVRQRLIGQIGDLHPPRALWCGGCTPHVGDEDSQLEREMSEYVPHSAWQLAPSRAYRPAIVSLGAGWSSEWLVVGGCPTCIRSESQEAAAAGL